MRKKVNKKALITSMSLLGAASVSLGVTLPIVLASNNDWILIGSKPNSSINFDDFNNIEVNNDNFIKGADVSSYANLVEEFLWSKNITKKTNNSVMSYKYSEFENTLINIDGKNMTLEEYVDENLFSYINENGERIFANFFSILKNQVGMNSLRLRVWVDPYDENGFSYGGGHNDIDTTIWIINQSKKYGFNHFNIDFHYSDFWADPERQYVPKAWENLSTEELMQTIKDYTYDSLVKLYNSTGIVPNQIQIGNEVTKGMLWKTSSNQTFIDGKMNIEQSSLYISKGIEGVKEFEKYLLENHKLSRNIEITLHIDNLTGDLQKKSTENYLSNEYLMENVDIIGLTYYPMWQNNFDFLYDSLVNFYSKFNKKIIISEFSSPWTTVESDLSFNLINDYAKHYIPYSTNGQTILFNGFMETISKALPNIETGFYYWEPAWLQIGRLTWATREGVLKSFNNSENALKENKVGNSWWDQSLFDRNGILLSSAKTIKNFSRNDKSNNVYDFNNEMEEDLVGKIDYCDSLVTKSEIAKNLNIHISEGFYKIKIEDEMYSFYDDKKNDTLYFYDEYDFDGNSNELRKFVEEKVKNNYPRVMWHQVHFDDFKFDLDTKIGSIKIIANNNSFAYSDEVTINFEFKNFISHSIDLSSNVIEINGHDTNWSNLIISNIKNNVVDFGTLFYNTFNITGNVSQDGNENYNFWAYDENHGLNRDIEWILLKSDLVYEVKTKKAQYDQINKYRYTWPTNGLKDILKTGINDFYFSIRIAINDYQEWDGGYKKSTLETYGTENWKNIPLLTFKFKLNIL